MQRREFLLVSAAVAVSNLRGQEASMAGLSVRFRTDAGRLARMLPPGFEAGKEAYAQIDFAADASWARVVVAGRYAELDGWFPVAYWTGTDSQRFLAREALGLGAKLAEIQVNEGQGQVSVGGEVILKVSVKHSGDPSAADGLPLFGLRYSLHEDWTQGIVSGAADVLAMDWPVLDPDAENSADATAEWLVLSPTEPATELPILEIVGASLSHPPSALADVAKGPEAIGTIASQDIAAWSPLRYPRPSVDRVIHRPNGWPDQATAMRWSETEIDRWQERPETRFDPVEIVEVNAVVSPEVHAQLLPPPCVAGSRPLVKMLGLRFERDGELPVNELWLMTYCGIGRVGAWYTLAHVVGPGGDLVYGRESFGYPTKSGDPRVVVTPIDCSLTGTRQGREFFYADGAFGGFSTGTTLGRLTTLSLRVRPGQQSGELVLQPWTYQGRRQQVTSVTASMSAPDGASQGELRLDPWFDLGPMQIVSIAALETGLMQRAPGKVVATVANPAPFYRERCDGVAPWESAPEERNQPSFLVNAEEAARS